MLTKVKEAVIKIFVKETNFSNSMDDVALASLTHVKIR
jgi:hypothetical protein